MNKKRLISIFFNFNGTEGNVRVLGGGQLARKRENMENKKRICVLCLQLPQSMLIIFHFIIPNVNIEFVFFFLLLYGNKVKKMNSYKYVIICNSNIMYMKIHTKKVNKYPFVTIQHIKPSNVCTYIIKYHVK